MLPRPPSQRVRSAYDRKRSLTAGGPSDLKSPTIGSSAALSFPAGGNAANSRGGGGVGSTTTTPAAVPITLPKATQEQLLALCLRYEGVTRERIPDFVADLNLAIPVDFDVESYFSSGGPGGTHQLILQPDDLLVFVQDLQAAARRPSDSVDDTVLLLAQPESAVSPTSSMIDYHAKSSLAFDESIAMGAAASNRQHGAGLDTAGSVALSRMSQHQQQQQQHVYAVSLPDYIDKASVLRLLEPFFPDAAHSAAAAAAAVFSSTSSAPQQQSPPSLHSAASFRGGLPKPPALASSAVANESGTSAAAQQQQRQPLGRFRRFLDDDDVGTNADGGGRSFHYIRDAFRRCGAVDDGCGWALTEFDFRRAAAESQVFLDREVVTLAARILELPQRGEIDLAWFETVVTAELLAASSGCGGTTGVLSTTTTTTVAVSSTLAPSGGIQQLSPSLNVGGASITSIGSQKVGSQGAVASTAATNFVASVASSATVPNSGSSTSGNNAGTSSAVASSPTASAASIDIRRIPLAVVLAVLAPATVAALCGRQTLRVLLELRTRVGLAAKAALASATTAGSLGVGGANSGPLVSGGSGTGAIGGGGGGNAGSGGGGNGTPSSAELDVEQMLAGVDGRKRRVGGGSHRTATVVPRYMQRRHDDEITAAVIHRAQERRRHDAERAQSARAANSHTLSLRIARVRYAPASANRSPHKQPQRPPEELDIDYVLSSRPGEGGGRNGAATVGGRGSLYEPKGFALLRQKREPHEVLSSAGSLTEKFMINHDKDDAFASPFSALPAGAPDNSSRHDVTAIVDNALSSTASANAVAPQIPPRVAALLADPYASPPIRLHSPRDVRYVYRTQIDPRRASPRRKAASAAAASTQPQL